MKRQPGGLARVAAAVVSIVIVGGCSRSGDDAAEPTAAVANAPASTAPADEAGAESAPVASTTAPPAASATAATAASTLPPPATPVSVVALDEVGTPGLDSEDAFCASWSRFAGSFQVVAVTSAFGSGSPGELAALEVAAAPTVTASYRELFENWPDELAAEESLVADEFLGPFARRLTEARDALDAVGADDATIDTITEAWLVGLSQRDPTTPEFVVDLSDDVWATIDDAAAVFSGQRVPFGSDPSLVTNVVTPLTDEYLAVSCPDQGTLSGQEVGSP